MLKEYNDEMYHDIIKSMVAVLEAKDLYTSDDSIRVANMA